MIFDQKFSRDWFIIDIEVKFSWDFRISISKNDFVITRINSKFKDRFLTIDIIVSSGLFGTPSRFFIGGEHDQVIEEIFPIGLSLPCSLGIFGQPSVFQPGSFFESFSFIEDPSWSFSSSETDFYRASSWIGVLWICITNSTLDLGTAVRHGSGRPGSLDFFVSVDFYLNNELLSSDRFNVLDDSFHPFFVVFDINEIPDLDKLNRRGDGVIFSECYGHVVVIGASSST